MSFVNAIFNKKPSDKKQAFYLIEDTGKENYICDFIPTGRLVRISQPIFERLTQDLQKNVDYKITGGKEALVLTKQHNEAVGELKDKLAKAQIDLAQADSKNVKLARELQDEKDIGLTKDEKIRELENEISNLKSDLESLTSPASDTQDVDAVDTDAKKKGRPPAQNK